MTERSAQASAPGVGAAGGGSPTARILNGTAVAAAIRSELKPRVQAFAARYGRQPSLHIVLAGDDPASHIYVRNKERAGTEAGITVTVHRLPSDVSAAAVRDLVVDLNRDSRCDGILVQSPLPPAIAKTSAQQVFDTIDPAKDVDSFHPTNVGLLVQGRARLAPCTPSGVIALLDREGITISGQHAVVIGRSEIVGKPMALLLLERHATVTICHSRTRDLPALARQADILVAAIGRAGFVTREFIKPGAVVVDVGINRIDARAAAEAFFGAGSPRLADFDRKGTAIGGDVHPTVAEVAGALTPVPGGVGPLTIAMLLKNTLTAAEDRSSITE
jgi:methylenetetrahydrofolate dehydrogenase (NADP+)/methenyltetrahydrofolate cyclohydrolase